MRIRYLLREQIQAGAEPVESFAEEIVLAACQREDGGLRWLEPIDRAGRALADRAQPTANMSQPEKREQLAWALDFLESNGTWYRPVVDHRVAALVDAHQRLRKLTRAPQARDPAPRAA